MDSGFLRSESLCVVVEVTYLIFKVHLFLSTLSQITLQIIDICYYQKLVYLGSVGCLICCIYPWQSYSSDVDNQGWTNTAVERLQV